MSVQTRPPRRTGSAARDQLPRGAASVSRGREISLGVAGTAGLLLLVVGIPLGLALLVGYPLPRSAPSKDWLTVSISATLIINILACVVWIVWAHFVVCLLAEWRALRRGRIPGHVAMGGGSQLLARRLVAAALLLAGAATTFSQVSGAGSTPHAPAVAAVHQQATTGSAAQARSATAAENAAAAGNTAAAGTAGQHAAGETVKYYVVEPPNGRRYDSLWDIAERTLKDPLRYKEIFALNRDRTQADGRKLVDANLIQPGWQLQLPADASGPGVRSTPAPGRPAATPAAPARAAGAASPVGDAPVRHGAASSASAASAVPAASGATVAGGAHARSGQPSSSTQDALPTELLGGGLMLAGIALALTARRGPYAIADDDENVLTAAADLGLALSLDRALRNLAAARKDQGLDLPQPVLAWASEDEVSLALAGGDRSDPPAPWRAESDAVWSATLAAVTDHPRLAETAAPFPGLLSVGRDDGREVFVDVEQAPGLISVGGDAGRGRDLVTSLAAQAVTCPWSDGAQATLVGFSDGEQLAGLDNRRITHVPALGDVLDDLERRQADLARLQRSLGVDGVLHGRQSRRSGAWAPHLILLSGPPSPDEAGRLTRLAGQGRSQFVVLVVGDVRTAAWRFVIDGERMLDLGVLGAGARAHQLDRNAMLQLIDTLQQARTAAARQDADVAALAPRAALANAADTSGDDPNRGGAALAVRAERPAPDEARASVALLGPVAVDADGPIDPGKRELAAEIVVAAALAPTGIPGVVLRSAIWPRGVSDDVFAAAMADTAGWLGVDRAGRPALREVDGRWVLGPSVWIDWEDLQLAVQAARGGTELDALQHAVSLLRGEGFSGVPATRYGWLSFRRCARDAAVIATTVARRAAALLGQDGRPDEAEQVLRRGLAFVPTAEPLWRDLLELAGRRGPDAAAAVADQMYEVLTAHRVWAQPETDALVSQLAPGRTVPESA